MRGDKELFDLATRIAEAVPPERTNAVIEKLENLPPEKLKQAFLAICCRQYQFFSEKGR